MNLVGDVLMMLKISEYHVLKKKNSVFCAY